MICDYRNLFLGSPTHNIHHMGQKSKFHKRLFVTTGFSYSSLIPTNIHFYVRDSYFLYRYHILGPVYKFLTLHIYHIAQMARKLLNVHFL